MKPIYIQEIGILSNCAGNKEELFQIVSGENHRKEYPRGKIDFSMTVSPSKLRRCSRYTKLAVNAAAQAVKHAGKETGTVISTGYGAVESNIDFADSVVKGDPAMCSPTVFSSTVPNSCAGQICIVNGFQGEGTMLTGGDLLEYAALLIHSKKAEQILCGSVEEYNEELAKELGMEGILQPKELSEGAVMLLVSGYADKDSYCRVTEFSSGGFCGCPYLSHVPETEAQKIIKEAFLGISRQPDMILLQANHTYLDKAEREAAREIFGETVPCCEPKLLFGETLGCAYLLNVAFGAVYLKTGKTEVHSVLAAGLDMHGNYMTALLEV